MEEPKNYEEAMDAYQTAARESMALQETIALILEQQGGTIVIAKERIEQGFPPEAGIEVHEDVASNAFVWQLVGA